MLVLASVVLGFATLDALSGFMVLWLYLTPLRPCLDVTMWEALPWYRLLCAYLSPFPLSTTLCLPCLFVHPLAFYASLHACLHVHAWILLASVLSMLQHNEVMDIRSKPTFVPYGHHLLFAFLLICLLSYLLACLFAFLLSCLLFYLMACHVSCHMLCLPCLPYFLLYASSSCSLHLFLSIACLLVSYLCLCMYTHGARTHKARAWSPKRKRKGRGCEYVDISQVAMCNRFRGLAFPIWLCTFLNPIPSSLLFLLNGLY